MNDWKPSVPPGMSPDEYRDWWERETDVPYGACWCGCGGKTTTATQTAPAHGHINGCPKRYVRGHHLRKSPLEYKVDPETGCWVWQRGRHDFGYGVFHARPKMYLAHRVYYERYKGPIPDGHVVHHRCENPPCVNPDHLQAVTQGHNVRASRGTKLDPRAVEEIRAAIPPLKPLAEKYGVSINTIYTLRGGQNWH